MPNELNIDNILRNMGVDRTIPPKWLPHTHKAIDQRTGEVFKTYPNGYICSYCGKHSWSKKEICTGCNSIMKQEG